MGIVGFTSWIAGLSLALPLAGSVQEPPTILTFGDSITEGAAQFSSYRQVLVAELEDKDIEVRFIGPKKDRISAHGGFSSKSSTELRAIAPRIYEESPADIVLLHSGHNHFSSQSPVGQILRDTEEICRVFDAQNPRVQILLAQVIPSGKLPKYDYIPELNRSLAKLARELQDEGLAITLVDQYSRFDWKSHTVADRVHPNPEGAQAMAESWLAALLPLLGHGPVKHYQRVALWDGLAPGSALKIGAEKKHPNGRTSHVSRPTLEVYRPYEPNGMSLVICSGGGYRRLASGPLGLGAADEFLDDGYTVFSLKYRLAPPSSDVVRDATADGAEALRLIRSHAAEWELDPTQVGMIGFSAGSDLILNLAGRDGRAPKRAEKFEDRPVDQPDFMVLAAPWRHEPSNRANLPIGPQMSPALILAADDDQTVPVSQVRELAAALRKAGNEVQLEVYERGGHMAFNFPSPKAEDWPKRLRLWLRDQRTRR